MERLKKKKNWNDKNCGKLKIEDNIPGYYNGHSQR